MSKNKFKAQASSSRALPAGSGATFGTGFGSTGLGFGSSASQLSYLAEQPELSQISDPNVVVSFRNLSKKDSTTKAKALEDLQKSVSSLTESAQTPDEAFLNAWVKIYPRTSIDASRRVRQLAHNLQGQLCVAVGKGILKLLPLLVGAWLCGLHDADKVVSLAAHEALNLAFPTAEKRINVRKAYQSSILEYCRDSVLNESPQTLSDERSTKLEDAEAKYYRVVSSGLFLITDLLRSLPSNETEKQEALYDSLLASESIYQHLSSADSTVRRSILQLLKIFMELRPNSISVHLDKVAQGIFSKDTLTNQRGSISDYAQTLQALALIHSDVWTTKINGKSVIFQLQHLFKQGSQGGGSLFWKSMTSIVEQIPEDSMADLDSLKRLLSSVKIGIARRDEPRTNAESAWGCYLVVCDHLSAKLSQYERRQLAADLKFPFVRQYLQQNADDSQWTISGPRSSHIIIAFMKSDFMEEIGAVEWLGLTSTFEEQIQVSAPQQSKDFIASQEALSAQGERWFALESAILANSPEAEFRHVLDESTHQILETCLSVLRSRNGKPYGAAAITESAFHWLCGILLDQNEVTSLVISFLLHDLPSLISSPSRDSLMSLLYDLSVSPDFGRVWDSTLSAILELEDQTVKSETLLQFLNNERLPNAFSRSENNAQLQSVVQNLGTDALSDEQNLTILSGLFSATGMVFSAPTLTNLLETVTTALNSEIYASPALKLLLALFKSNNSRLVERSLEVAKPELLQSVLFLTESANDAIANEALEVNESIQMSTANSVNGTASRIHELDVIRADLRKADMNSLTIDTLVGLAMNALPKLSQEELANPQTLLPPFELWWETLNPFLDQRVPEARAITNQLGGAVYLVAQPKDDSQDGLNIPRDRIGYSVALRLASYSVKVVENSSVSRSLSPTEQAELLCLLQITSNLVNEELTTASDSGIWSSDDPAAEEEASSFVSETESLLRKWFRNYDVQFKSDETEPAVDFLDIARRSFFEASSGTSAKSWQNAIAHSVLMSELIEMHGWQKISHLDLDQMFKDLRHGSNYLALASFLTAFSIPLSSKPSFARFCNELIANLTGMDIESEAISILRQLVFLNIIIQDHQNIVESIAKQRIIFLVKHIAPWVGDIAVADEIKAEVYKVLAILLPAMKEIYSGEWSSIVQSLVQIFSHPELKLKRYQSSGRLPLMHASLKLFDILRRMQFDDDCNDDLRDAWKDSSTGLAQGLVTVLQQSGSLTDEGNQPLRITNELLSRQIASNPVDRIEDVGELYPLILAESSPVQQTAFNLLHRQIPAQQEQISIDVALDKSEARLPEELASLIVSVPQVESIADTTFERKMPSEVRGYLASWLLVFDHFQNASDKVKTDYSTNIKEGNYLDGLLNFMFSILGHSRGKPLDISRFDVSVYSFDIEESPIRDMQWLLSHVYFLCLLRLPKLTQDWWFDCSSRATVTSVESWTETYFSPVIIAKALTTVSEWADTQDRHSDEAILVKVNQKAKEVTASKEIDDQLMTIAIRFPTNFPLRRAVVEGINRVAVDQKKWNSWLSNTEGVINFSNNSVVDGLIAFRRNVTGALKGQSECAICYSIISQDKQLPTKKCGTCKNLFHGSCLFRWFKSSNSSSCPLCRNPFAYA